MTPAIVIILSGTVTLALLMWLYHRNSKRKEICALKEMAKRPFVFRKFFGEWDMNQKPISSNNMENLTDQEKIAMGICVSPLTVDRCPYCIDTCDASHWKNKLNNELEKTGINRKEN